MDVGGDSEEMDKKVKKEKNGKPETSMCNKHRKGSRCFLSLPRTNEEVDLNPSLRYLG